LLGEFYFFVEGVLSMIASYHMVPQLTGQVPVNTIHAFSVRGEKANTLSWIFLEDIENAPEGTRGFS
jgi:hypothetical protein